MKKLLIGLGVLFGVGLAVAKSKINTITEIVNQLSLRVIKIEIITRLEDIITGVATSLDLNVDIGISNNSNFDLSVATAKLITLKHIEIFSASGNFIALAPLNITDIEILSKQEIIFNKIPVSVPLDGIPQATIDLLFNNQGVKVVATLSILGNEIKI
ncbi:MAG: hypothetical protein HRT68_13255 [Flavobacteriaceae bacterium]|nr:hypothetical protein [Flavobacteriaceae bacterium]